MESSSKDESLLKIQGDKVVMNGDLYTKKKKFMRKYWDRCYGILTKDYLTLCDNKNSKESRKRYPISKFEWSLPDDKVADEDYCFVITYEERHKQPLLFACDREVTRDTWIEHIREMIIMCKKFSADSAYASGGSISSRQDERTSLYSVIDELKIKITSSEDKRGEITLSSTVSSNRTNLTDSGFLNVQNNTQETRQKATTGSGAINPRMDTLKPPLPETSGASSDLCSVDDKKDNYENVQIINNTLVKNEVTFSNKQPDSGFIKVQQNTDETRQKATTGSKTIDPRMDTLKPLLQETSGASSDLCSVEGYIDDYENVQIIDEDVNTLIKNEVTFSNKQPDSGFMKVQQNTHKTRQKATTGSKTIDPRMDTLKPPLQETSGASSDLCSVEGYKDDYENVQIIDEDVNTLIKKKVTLSNKQPDSGFIKVQQNTDETRLKATTGSKTIDPRMDTLKLPLQETSGASSDLCSVEGYKDDYENVQIIDGKTLIKNEVTFSNKQPDSGFMKVQQNTHKTRQKATTGSKTIDPRMDTLKPPLQETSGASSDLCSVEGYIDDYENVQIIDEDVNTLIKKKVTLSNKQPDSGFIKVQQNTDETRLKATTGSKTIDPRMDTLKLPLQETSGASSDLCSVEGYKDDYENVQIIDGKTLIKNKVTLSNKQPDSGFMKVQQKPDKTRQKATTGSKAIDPSIDSMKLPLSECIGARNDFCSVHDGQDDNENGETIKETLRRNKVIKTAGEKTVKKCNQSTESDKEIVDSHETEEVVLRSTSNSPSRSEASRSSGDSDQIYEHVTIADDSKRFKAVEYMCHDRNNKTELSQMPEGTFCVRPGRYTKQELAVTKPDGKISVFRIHEQLGCVYLSEDQQFSSLDDLINYYRQTVLPTEKYKLTLMRGFHS